MFPSDLEGQHNKLAAPSYNRDGKRFKKQVVVGLLTNAQGEPLSVHVYEGNRADPTTVADVVQTLAAAFGGVAVVLVGDRVMLKGPGRKAHGLRNQLRRRMRRVLVLKAFARLPPGRGRLSALCATVPPSRHPTGGASRACRARR